MTRAATVFASLVFAACTADDPGSAVTKPAPGTLHATAVGSANATGVQYSVVCDDGTTSSTYVPIEAEGLPPAASAAQAGKPFADLFQTLQPGHCKVTVTAMKKEGEPLPDCAPVSQDVTIEPEKTVELLLVIQCTPPPKGGLDVITVIVDGPHLVSLVYSPSKFVVRCEEQTITLSASGGDKPLTTTFELVSAPLDALYTMTPNGSTLVFRGETMGTYQVKATITDGVTTSSLTFPIHVSAGPVEHCTDTCCKLGDRHTRIGKDACTAQKGLSVPDAECAAEVCCTTIDGKALVPAANCPAGGLLALDACFAPEPKTCCRTGKFGELSVVQNDAVCASFKGKVIPYEVCQTPTCCAKDALFGGEYGYVPAVSCPLFHAADPLYCDPKELCCELPTGFVLELSNLCFAAGGFAAEASLCQPTPICCAVDGKHLTLEPNTCKVGGGTPADPPDCLPKDVCCALKGAHVAMKDDACVAGGGKVVPLDQCVPKEICCHTGGKYVFSADDVCVTTGGVIVADAECLPKDVCCDVAAFYYTLKDNLCAEKGGLPVDGALCTPKSCCVLATGDSAVMPEGQCTKQGGQILAVEQCTAVCCLNPAAGFSLQPTFRCPAPPFTVTPQALCTLDEVCCTVGGVLNTTSNQECYLSGGAEVDPTQCQLKPVCCFTAGLHATQTNLSCQQGGGQVVPDADCVPKDVCCKVGNGFPITISNLKCEQAKGTPVAAEGCVVKDVCCALAGSFTVKKNKDCVAAGGTFADAAACVPKDVCCSTGGKVFTQKDDQCLAGLGMIVDPVQCEPKVCCAAADGTSAVLPQTTCAKQQGAAKDKALCTTICCTFPKGVADKRLGWQCVEAGGVVADMTQCAVLTKQFNANHKLKPGGVCDPAPYLVIPSSGANKLAVFRLDNLQPLPTTPFATCASPSRVMMDQNTDVYATCRGEGSVVKHTRDGVVLWKRAFAGCNATKGIAMNGAGRLFAGCETGSNGTLGRIWELDAATGDVLKFVDASSNSQFLTVYGLAVDKDGLYATGSSTGHVAKITLGGAADMTVAWRKPYSNPYGIATDRKGSVWITGNQLRRLRTSDGVQDFSLPLTQTESTFLLGVQVGLDGNVYAANSATVFKHVPATQTATKLFTDGSIGGDVHGLTLDAANNLYAISNTASLVTKLTPALQQTPFGSAVLQNPYAYSGDQTGVLNICGLAATDSWTSAEIDGGSATTTWQSITWTFTTPPGSSITVYYSLDGGVTWLVAANGATMQGVVGQKLRLKALLKSTIAGNEPTLNNVSVKYKP